MSDYTWPSVYFSYLFFALSMGVAVFFFVRSWKAGDLRKENEDVKFRVFDEAEEVEDLPAGDRSSHASR
jgi:hypothetical protein